MKHLASERRPIQSGESWDCNDYPSSAFLYFARLDLLRLVGRANRGAMSTATYEDIGLIRAEYSKRPFR